MVNNSFYIIFSILYNLYNFERFIFHTYLNTLFDLLPIMEEITHYWVKFSGTSKQIERIIRKINTSLFMIRSLEWQSHSLPNLVKRKIEDDLDIRLEG